MFIKKVITAAFVKSINSAPTRGTIKKAFVEKPFTDVKDSILAIAVGVAPIQNPQCPVTITAASYLVAINGSLITLYVIK